MQTRKFSKSFITFVVFLQSTSLLDVFFNHNNNGLDFSYDLKRKCATGIHSYLERSYTVCVYMKWDMD